MTNTFESRLRARVQLAQGLMGTGKFGESISALFDCADFIDRHLADGNIGSSLDAITKLAVPTFKQWCDELHSSSYDPLRHAVMNNAINWLMLCVEYLEGDGKSDAARSVLAQAYEHCKELLAAGAWEKFPERDQILRRLSWNDTYAGPKTVCDVESARNRLIEMEQQIRSRLDRIASNLTLAEHIIRDASSLVRRTKNMFELDGDVLDVGEGLVFRIKPRPASLRAAESMILAGELWLKDIDKTVPSRSNLYRSERALAIARLVDAAVQGYIAYAYVDFWKDVKGFADFEVLAHQAMAYAEAVHLDNWDCFVPLILYRPDRKIHKEADAEVRMFQGFGAAALAYAQALNAQMQAWSVRPVARPKFQKVPKGPEQTPVQPYQWPTVRSWMGQMAAAEKMRTNFLAHMYDEKREDYHYGIGRNRIYPKRRLVGFDKFRSGGRRRRRATAS